MITTLHLSSAFVPMGRFQFPSLMFLDLYMTVKSLSLEYLQQVGGSIWFICGKVLC
jgi:hypothetical protein